MNGSYYVSSNTHRWAGYLHYSAVTDQAQNGSWVSVSCEVWKTNADITSGGASFVGSIWVGGTKKTFAFQEVRPQSKTVGSLERVWVPHNGQGDASVEIGFHIEKGAGTTLAWAKLGRSAVITLENIPQESPVRLGAQRVQMGGRVLISMDRASAGHTHRLLCRFGGADTLIAEKAEDSFQWTVPDLGDRCPDALEGKGVIRCETYRDGTYVGVSQAELTIALPDPLTPTAPGEDFPMGRELRLETPRASRCFTTEGELLWQGKTRKIWEKHSGEVSAFLPDYDLAADIPDLTQGTAVIRVVTWNGSARVGQRELPIRLVVPENESTRPVVEEVTITRLGFTDAFVQSKTGIRAEIQARSPYSRIESCKMHIGPQSAVGNPGEIPILTTPGDLSLVVEVTDRRGFRGEKSIPVTVLPYQNPRILPPPGGVEVICRRADPTGSLTPGGTWLAIRCRKSCAGVIHQGKQLNFAALSYRWRREGSPFSQWIRLLDQDQDSLEILLDGICTSTTHSYRVELRTEDLLGGTHQMSFLLPTETVSFALYDGVDGAAFGKYPELPHVVDLGSQMTLRVRGHLLVEGDGWQAEPGLPGWMRRISQGSRVTLKPSGLCPDQGSLGTTEKLPPEDCLILCPTTKGFCGLAVTRTGAVEVRWVQDLAQGERMFAGTADYWIEGGSDETLRKKKV